MTILQLNPPIPLITPKGTGLGWFVINESVEHNLQWVVAIDETGEVWTFDNTKIRAQKNITMGRTIPCEHLKVFSRFCFICDHFLSDDNEMGNKPVRCDKCLEMYRNPVTNFCLMCLLNKNEDSEFCRNVKKELNKKRCV